MSIMDYEEFSNYSQNNSLTNSYGLYEIVRKDKLQTELSTNDIILDF